MGLRIADFGFWIEDSVLVSGAVLRGAEREAAGGVVSVVSTDYGLLTLFSCHVFAAG